MNLNLRVLLVEGEPEEALFLKDVLTEIEETSQFRPWVGMEILHAQTCEDAELLLSTEPLDLILLNPDLPDRQGLPTFRRLQSLAPNVPVVLLLGQGDDSLGLRLVREGAQDFLIRKHIDCEPLAHALRTAVERQKPTIASDASRLRDTLTGLPTVGSFAIFAERDRRLAQLFGCRWMILAAEPVAYDGSADLLTEQRADLTLVETADCLREAASPADSVYRIGPKRFALTTFETGMESVGAKFERLAATLPREKVVLGHAVFEPEQPRDLELLLAEAQEDLSRPLTRKPTSGVALPPSRKITAA